MERAERVQMIRTAWFVAGYVDCDDQPAMRRSNYGVSNTDYLPGYYDPSIPRQVTGLPRIYEGEVRKERGLSATGKSLSVSTGMTPYECRKTTT